MSKRTAAPATAAESATSGRGRAAEDFALDLLQQNGFHLIERNYACKGGELDLIMQHGDDLVFVEVRYRRIDAFGDGGESVDQHKQRKLRIAAERWLQDNMSRTFRGCRFAVMSVSGDPGYFDHEWIDDAF